MAAVALVDYKAYDKATMTAREKLLFANIEALADPESNPTTVADCAMTGTNVESTDEDSMYHCAAGTDDNTVYACSGSVKESFWSSTKKCKTN